MLREVLLLINCSYTYKIQSYYAEKWMHITCTNRPCSLNYSPQPLLLQSNLLVIPVSLSNKRNIHIPFPFWTHTGRKKGIKRKKKKTHQTNEDQFLVNRAITQGEVGYFLECAAEEVSLHGVRWVELKRVEPKHVNGNSKMLLLMCEI